METLRPNLGNAQGWEFVTDESLTANIINTTPPSHDPIPDRIVPVQVESPTILIYCTTPNKKPKWKFGGTVFGMVYTGVTTGGQNLSSIGSAPIFLEEKTILRFPSLSDNYSLKFKIPIWFKGFYYSIWQYTGAGIPDIEGKGDAIYLGLKSLMNV